MKTKETKIYHIHLILKDTIAKHKDESICVFTTDNKEKAEEIFKKLSENRNLKYILS